LKVFYSLETLWAFPWATDSSSAVQDISHYRFWRFINVITKLHHLTLSWETTQCTLLQLISWRYILNLSSHLCLHLPHALLLAVSKPKFLFHSMYATHPTHFILLQSTSLKSKKCDAHYYVIFSIPTLLPLRFKYNILLSILFLYSISVFCSQWETKFHTHTLQHVKEFYTHGGETC